MKTTEIKGQVDFAIITIREDEFRAALQRFPPVDLVDGERRYSLSSATLKTGETRSVVVVRTSEQGEGEAISAALQAVREAARGTVSHAIHSRIEELDRISKPFAGRRMDRSIAQALSGRAVTELERETVHARGIEPHLKTTEE